MLTRLLLLYTEPVADLAKEQPYEVLNSLQNHIATPGQNVYMKGCFAPQPFPRALLPSVFQRVVAHSAPEVYTFGLLMEYVPLAQANAVPDDATAYRRGLAPNVLAAVYAKEDGQDAFNYSRDSARALIELFTSEGGDNLGYGNYSTFPFLLFCLSERYGKRH